MIRTFTIFLLITLIAPASLISAENAWIHNGFLKGVNYIQMDFETRKICTASVIDGMLLAPLFGAPKEEMKWLESYLKDKPILQLTAIVTKYLEDKPEIWHEELHALTFQALKAAYKKNSEKKEKTLQKEKKE